MKKIKLLLSAILILFTINTFTIESSAASNITIYVDGVQQSFSSKATVKNGTTLVPLRGIFEELGADVKWNQSTKTIDASKDGTKIWLKLGSKSTKVNGQTVNISVPAQAVNGVTLVPLRFISESLGTKVNWNQATKTIKITQDGSITVTYDVILEFPADRFPETAAHIKTAIQNGESAICTIDRDGADENRDESLANIPTKDGYDRDEFPMAMCKEGGDGASVMYVNPSDNRGAGSWVGNQLEQYRDGTRVLFKVVGTVSTSPKPVEPNPEPKPETETETGDPSTGTYVIPGAPTTFKNCDAMREYYPNGVQSTHLAYSKSQDRDGDLWACEK